MSEVIMTQVQLLNEFRQLPLAQQLELLQALLGIVAQQVQVVEQPANGKAEYTSLAEAANLLLADYQEDQELTSFTVLDGAPFYA
jgi:hypothetical protein